VTRRAEAVYVRPGADVDAAVTGTGEAPPEINCVMAKILSKLFLGDYKYLISSTQTQI